jgi:hypothetical protein
MTHKHEAMILTDENEAVFDVDQSIDAYRQISDTYTYGPQQEGLIDSDLKGAVNDRAGYFLSIDGSSGETIVPFATPLSHVSTVNNEYFRAKFGQDYAKTVYFISPQVARLLIAQGQEGELVETAQKILQTGNFLFITDQQDSIADTPNITDYLKQQLDGKAEELPVLDEKNGSAASVIHFSGVPRFIETIELSNQNAPSFQEVYRSRVNQGKAEPLPTSGTAILLPEYATKELLEDIWAMYDAQMDILIENHPMFQRLEQDELFSMLLSDTGANVVHFEAGKPVCLFVGISDIKNAASWLRSGVIEERYGDDEEILYCPAMAADIHRQGMNYSQDVFSLLAELVEERGKNVRPYFECTNISAEYVPNHVFEPAINQTGICTVNVEEQASYSYRILSAPKDLLA